MNQVKIGIVEDEVIIADLIINILQSLGYETSTPCMTYTTALKMIENEKPDLILIDIQLAGKKNGIDLAQTINTEYGIPFIFLTSNADILTVEAAKKVNPDAFLVKPFTKEDLFTAIEIAISNNGKSYLKTENEKKLNDTILVKNKDNFYALKLNDILFVKSDHVYLEIYVENEYYIVRSTLEQFMSKLPKNDFVQVHRRYLVNLKSIISLNTETVFVKGHEIPISKSFKNDLMKIFNII